MMNRGDTVLRLRAVSYSYLGRYPAIVGIDLAVQAGERVAVLGANGCGKSTMLKVMDGLVRPDSGLVEAFGKDLSSSFDDPRAARMLRRRIGLVFQDSDVQLFSPTVRDDVAFGPLQLGLPPAEARQRVEEALETMGIQALASRAPYELSEGEKKRAAIATVLAVDPEVLLLDEPTASLDPRSKAVLIDLLLQLAEQGKTVVMTTQELDVATDVAPRAVVFGERERRPIADGETHQVLADTETLLRANLVHPRYRGRAG